MKQNDRSPTNPIQQQDEILQVLFWLRGEGLGNVVALAELNRFLTMKQSDLNEAIQRLIDNDLLKSTPHDDDTFRVSLTEAGVAEGQRRFKDEFENYLGQESHMECEDPNCDCHEPDFAGVCSHLLDKPSHS